MGITFVPNVPESTARTGRGKWRERTFGPKSCLAPPACGGSVSPGPQSPAPSGPVPAAVNPGSQLLPLPGFLWEP